MASRSKASKQRVMRADIMPVEGPFTREPDAYRRSPAFHSLSATALRILAIMSMTAQKPGADNAWFAMPYDTLAGYVGRNKIAAAIRQLEAVGLLVIRRGRFSQRSARKIPSTYRVTFLPQLDAAGRWVPATNEWRAFNPKDNPRGKSTGGGRMEDEAGTDPAEDDAAEDVPAEKVQKGALPRAAALPDRAGLCPAGGALRAPYPKILKNRPRKGSGASRPRKGSESGGSLDHEKGPLSGPEKGAGESMLILTNMFAEAGIARRAQAARLKSAMESGEPVRIVAASRPPFREDAIRERLLPALMAARTAATTESWADAVQQAMLDARWEDGDALVERWLAEGTRRTDASHTAPPVPADALAGADA